MGGEKNIVLGRTLLILELNLYLKYMPFDNRSPRVLQGFLPMFETGLIFLVLAPAKLYFSYWVSSTNQIVVTDLEY